MTLLWKLMGSRLKLWAKGTKNWDLIIEINVASMCYWLPVFVEVSLYIYKNIGSIIFFLSFCTQRSRGDPLGWFWCWLCHWVFRSFYDIRESFISFEGCYIHLPVHLVFSLSYSPLPYSCHLQILIWAYLFPLYRLVPRKS